MSYLTELRKHIGHSPLLMVGATVFVFDEKDRLLLLKRADNGCWGPPGGAVEPGEVVEEAAMRETFEETGLHLEGLSLYGVFSGDDQFYRYPNGDEVHNVTITYFARAERASVRISPEHTEWRFFTLNELPASISPPIVPILNKILAGHVAGTES
ncbi:MAG: NUDIX domain-containing protein [Chloroflexi bacterium]|nr:NUDIX domain-containing protein [Chloroflexota bacterium]